MDLKVDKISLFLKFEVFISQLQTPFHSSPQKRKHILDSESIFHDQKRKPNYDRNSESCPSQGDLSADTTS